MRRPQLLPTLALLLIGATALPARAVDDAHRAQAKQVIDKAVAYLRAQQAPDGSWSAKPGPAVTALVVAGMLDHGVPATDPAVKKGLDYVLSRQKPSGGIYDEILENYNTSIALMALGRAPQDDKTRGAIKLAQDYLRKMQWAEDSSQPGASVDKDHPFYGGAGYGKHGRPDLSNTAVMIAGLHDSGLNCNDPAYQRAMAFISKLQGSKANTANADKIVPDGGFIYAAGDKDHPGQLSTNVDPPTQLDASGHSRLITYGSMTYAGFMSYLYAELDKSDPRVADAYQWVRHNYNLDENPRVGMQGYFYYLHVLSRALAAWGEPTLTTADGKTHDWQNELIEKIAALQKPDGSFLNEKDRWMEGNAQLDTAYAILALRNAAK